MSGPSLGIIGGADGPTAIIVSGSPWGLLLPLLALAAAAAALALYLRRRR